MKTASESDQPATPTASQKRNRASRPPPPHPLSASTHFRHLLTKIMTLRALPSPPSCPWSPEPPSCPSTEPPLSPPPPLARRVFRLSGSLQRLSEASTLSVLLRSKQRARPSGGTGDRNLRHHGEIGSYVFLLDDQFSRLLFTPGALMDPSQERACQRRREICFLRAPRTPLFCPQGSLTVPPGDKNFAACRRRSRHVS